MKIQYLGPHIVVPSVDWGSDQEAPPGQAGLVQSLAAAQRGGVAGEHPSGQDFTRAILERLRAFADNHGKRRDAGARSRLTKKALAAYRRHEGLEQDLASKGNTVRIKI